MATDIAATAKGGVLLPNSLSKQPSFLTEGQTTFDISFSISHEGYFEVKYPKGYVKHHDLNGDYGLLVLAIINNLKARHDLPDFTSKSTIEEAKQAFKFTFAVTGE
jgi:hypothetical protein